MSEGVFGVGLFVLIVALLIVVPWWLLRRKASTRAAVGDDDALRGWMAFALPVMSREELDAAEASRARAEATRLRNASTPDADPTDSTA